MTWILIVMWFGTGSSGDSGKTSLAVEFNDKASCQAAASEIMKQYKHVGTLICAAKGEKK